MPLLVVHLTMMSIQIESPAGTTPFKRLTLQAGGPILNASSTAVGEAVRVCKGAGDPLLRLSYVGNSEAIEVNDAVLTSGLDGIFPKGLPLGRVVSSQKGTSVFRIVRVQPAADVARAEEVLVVVNRVPEAA